MLEGNEILVALLLFGGAVLYTSVGHAGASAYIAIMSLTGMTSATIKPTALVLNILVATYSGRRYFQSGLFDKTIFVPLVIGAVPAAFLGGYLTLPEDTYKSVVGGVLVLTGVRFLATRQTQTEASIRRPPIVLAVFVGATIGFLAGLTGTGGGIFLSPVLILFSWTSVKGASGTAALFILANSISGLFGNLNAIGQLPKTLPLFSVAVLLGAYIGTNFGIRYFSHVGVRRALGAVLIIAGGKLSLHL